MQIFQIVYFDFEIMFIKVVCEIINWLLFVHMEFIKSPWNVVKGRNQGRPRRLTIQPSEKVKRKKKNNIVEN